MEIQIYNTLKQIKGIDMFEISPVLLKNKFSCFFYITPVLLTCIIVLFGCSKPVEKSKIENQASLLLNQMESSAIDLEHIIDEIAGLKRINTRERIKEANSVIKKGRGVLKRSEKDVYEYKSFIRKNSDALTSEKLDHYILIKGILNQSLSLKRSAIEDYLSKMDKWLSYSLENFEKLNTGSHSHRMNYDKYLIEVDRSLEVYNSANSKHLLFINSYLKENPGIVKHFEPEYKTMKKELGWL